MRSLYAAHKRHGPIVRLAPGEVSVASEEGLKKVYVDGLDKAVWYQQTFYNYGVQNLVSTLDHKTHSAVRRMINGFYTKSFVQRSADLDQLSCRIIFERLLPRLRHYGEQRQEVNVVELLECVSVDFISGYIWGNERGTDFLDDQAGRHRYLGEWEKVRSSTHVEGKPFTETLYMNMTRDAIAKHRKAARSHPLVVTSMFDRMMARASEWNMTEDDIITRCASEMVDQVIATQETNTITLTYILYRLSQDPELQNKLRRDIRSLKLAIPTIDMQDRTLPAPADIDALPLLEAIVLETLRLHAPNPARMRRVVPAQGLTLHGYFLPAGTTISTNAYCLHRNSEKFPQPFEWIPHRWLPCPSEAMRRWFWAFASGPRRCIGESIAIQSKQPLNHSRTCLHIVCIDPKLHR